MKIEKQIEFDRIREIWKELALTDRAKERIDAAEIFLSERELRKELRDTTDAREMIEKCGNPPLQNVSEIAEILEAAEKGECLLPERLERVGVMFVATRRLRDYLSRGKVYNNSLAFYDENLV